MPPHERPRDFGRYLQALRIKQGISLEAVSRFTRITITQLRQIESEDLAGLPSPVFVKGFLRSFAEAVGADEQDVLQRFEASLQARLMAERRQARLASRASFLPRLLMALMIIAALIAASLFFHKTMQSSGHSEIQAGEETESAPAPDEELKPDQANAQNLPDQSGESEISTEQGKSAPAAERDAQSNSVQAPSVANSPFNLQVEALVPTWIKVIADNHIPRELSLKEGDTVVFEARKQFNILIGNATGVRLILNGNPVQVPGKSGQMVTLQLP